LEVRTVFYDISKAFSTEYGITVPYINFPQLEETVPFLTGSLLICLTEINASYTLIFILTGQSFNNGVPQGSILRPLIPWLIYKRYCWRFKLSFLETTWAYIYNCWESNRYSQAFKWRPSKS
jgi:hypothetical protein